MIGEHSTMFAHDVVSPYLECMYHRCKFQIMCGVVVFVVLKLSRGIGYHLPILHQYTSKSLPRSVTIDLKILLDIRQTQNWYRYETFLQLLKACFTCLGP